MKDATNARKWLYEHVWGKLGTSVSNYVFKRIWSLTDAYGPQGYIPVQGYDWSGIKDSSDQALIQMKDLAVKLGVK